ncbi:MAG: BatA domain-containing protein [Cyclobacteriaceae bacterium]|nr:BatA domain-containing protein [Cyclobacteriaceae bacterium]
MGFVSILSLLGLTLVSVPVIIHLMGRKKPKIVMFGTTDFLRQTGIRKTRTFQFTDIPLMIIRVFLVASLILSVAGPYLLLEKKKQAKTIYLVSRAWHESNNPTLFSTFPVDADVRRLTFENSWTALKKLEEERPDSVVVIFEGLARQLNGPKPELNYPVSLISIDQGANKKIQWESYAFGQDSAFSIDGLIMEKGTRFSQRAVPMSDLPDIAETGSKVDTLKVSIIGGQKESVDKIRAALLAIEKHLRINITWDTSQRIGTSHLTICMPGESSIQMPQVRFADLPDGELHWQSSGKGIAAILPLQLLDTPDWKSGCSLPELLLTLVKPLHENIPYRAIQGTLNVSPTGRQGANGQKKAIINIASGFLLLTLVLFIVERFYTAFYKTQQRPL